MPVIIVLFNRTAHVLDRARSVPPEYDSNGKIIQGGPVAKHVPCLTPFEVDDEAEAERILAHEHTQGVRIPDGADPATWLQQNADGLKVTLPAKIGATVHG